MCARSGPKLISIRETKEFNLSKCARTGPNFRFQALARIGPGLYLYVSFRLIRNPDFSDLIQNHFDQK